MVVVFIVVLQMPNIDECGEFDIYEGVMGVIPVRIDRGTVHLAFVCVRFEGWFAFGLRSFEGGRLRLRVAFGLNAIFWQYRQYKGLTFKIIFMRSHHKIGHIVSDIFMRGMSGNIKNI